MRSNREYDYFGNVLEYEYDYFASYSSTSTSNSKSTRTRVRVQVHEYDYSISGWHATHVISAENDEATSLPIERVPSLSGAAADRDIVDLDTLEQKAVDGNTAFVVRELLIVKVLRTDVSFYVGCAYCKKRMIVDDHGNLRCERHACVNGNTYFLVRVCFVESATGRSIWLTLFIQCMASLLDIGAKRPFSCKKKS